LRQKKYKATKELKSELEKIENDIAQLEEEKKKLEILLADPKTFSSPQLAKETNSKYEFTKNELESKYERWTTISQKIEEIEKQFE